MARRDVLLGVTQADAKLAGETGDPGLCYARRLQVHAFVDWGAGSGGRKSRQG